ncbi:hypothetical protein SAMN05216232_1292 [Virgibacillus subterraneus]|uniref:DUF1404 domain-containing protein n=1 Tax=Virgibacillus subterraneus TaxID=621109 RepID=A0A1H9BR43_9BACI|nr:hypothetical protein [Virgibacillus subterraneus]SEP91369.1 hypothetical protein SAMN05216232_1292 [Virgibacillus subterraneus]
MLQTKYGFLLFVLLIIPPIRNLMESVMVVHMLVQIPLLIISGWLISGYFQCKFPGFFSKWNSNGVPGIILVVFLITYWMIPRTLDEALNAWYIELFKIVSLPFLVGIPLQDSWKKLNSLGRSFIIFNFILMSGLMAWLYIDAPVRLCNNYLEVEQKVLGWGFLIITVSIVLYMLQNVFTDHSEGT